MTRALCSAVVFAIILAIAVGCEKTGEGEGAAHNILSPDGAWCWIQDPRAVYVEGRHKRTYAGWMTRDGKLQVGACDHETGSVELFTLKENWDVDDHNSNSFLVLPDKRLMVFYSKHNKNGLFCRAALKPEDISIWGNEVIVSNTPRITYSQPVYLSDEGRFYVFWRGPSWKPTFAWSTDARNWSAPRILIEEEGREARNVRPYMKVASDSKATIHFAFTDGHPRREPLNSIYYLKYQKGGFHKADGTKVGDMNSLPITPSKSGLVYDGKETKIRAWIWDIALDGDQLPVIVYTRLPSERDHRYHYACWTAGRWLDTEITPAGKWFPQTRLLRREREPHYSGGIALDHANPSIVYLSRQINGVFELERWITSNNGRTWSNMAITRESKHSNVRPIVPWGYTGDRDHVLWMHGAYVHYTRYETAIRMLGPEAHPAQQAAQ
jgi:BNR repeat-containing family member